MAEVVVFGLGQWADLAHFYLTHDSPHEVAAFSVDRDYLRGEEHRGMPVVAFEEVEESHPPERYEMFVPVSFKRMNHLRAEKFEEAKRKGYRLVSYVSSRATTWPGFECGENCFIFEGNTVQPFVEIGDDVVMWSGNHIGHHTTIKDHVTITSHVVVSGACTVESYCFLGVNSTVRDETVVAKETLVGAGSLILRDTKEFEVYKAQGTSPAKVRSDRLRSLSHKSGG